MGGTIIALHIAVESVCYVTKRQFSYQSDKPHIVDAARFCP